MMRAGKQKGNLIVETVRRRDAHSYCKDGNDDRRECSGSFYHLGPVEGAPLVAKHS